MTPQSGELTLKIKRIVPAAPPVMFGAFSTPDEAGAVVGAGAAPPHRASASTPAVGDSYRIQMQPPERQCLLPHRRVPRSRSARPPRLHVLMGGPRSRRRRDARRAVNSETSASPPRSSFPGPLQHRGAPRAPPERLDGQPRQARAIDLTGLLRARVSAPESRSLELVLPAVPASVSHARRAVASLLDRLDVDLWAGADRGQRGRRERGCPCVSGPGARAGAVGGVAR